MNAHLPDLPDIVLVLNLADPSLVEIYTNDAALAYHLERQGCRRDVPVFEENTLRAIVGARLSHLFVLPRQQVTLEAMTLAEQAGGRLAWSQLTDKGVQKKVSRARRHTRQSYEEALAKNAKHKREKRRLRTPAEKEADRAKNAARRQKRTQEQRQADIERKRAELARRTPEQIEARRVYRHEQYERWKAEGQPQSAAPGVQSDS